MGKHQLGSSGLTTNFLILVSLYLSASCQTGFSSPPSEYRAGGSAYSVGHSVERLTCLATTPENCANGNREIPWPSEGSVRQRAKRFLSLADSLSACGDSRSADYYYQAAVLSWQAMERIHYLNAQNPYWRSYQASLKGLITEANRYCRFQRSGFLRIYQPDGPVDVAITGRDLSWPIEQLSEFQIANIPKHPHLKCYYATAGLGIPLVVIRKPSYDCGSDLQERYFRPRLPLAATMSLRPRHQDSGECTSESCREFVLELANPLRVASIAVCGRRYPLARDISAPLEYHMANLSTNPLIGFLSPGSETQNEGLLWLEPYQPGKIPLIFVHGLLSDPSTWFDMLNHLRTQAWFNERYQVWGFSYDTGSPFVSSAARLRSQSRESLAMIDPHGQDPALGQMVLIGHSMGGLIAKLQISESGDQIWNSIAKVPLESIQTSEEIREQLAERLYFSPQPFVRRVVYIATPHCGSSFASLGIGRWSSLLIRPEDETQELHQQLVRANPGVFIGQFRKRVPSSIDLLQPSNPTLQAIYNLRVPKCIMQHTIIGTGKWPLTLGCGDGVVPLDSALHPCTVSKAFIASSHTGITQEDETTCEVARILRLHLDEFVSPEFEQN